MSTEDVAVVPIKPPRPLPTLVAVIVQAPAESTVKTPALITHGPLGTRVTLAPEVAEALRVKLAPACKVAGMGGVKVMVSVAGAGRTFTACELTPLNTKLPVEN